jgi:phage gpG-like protein
MKPTIHLVQDLITPDLQKKIQAAGKGREVLLAGAEQLVSLAQRAIKEPSLRVQTWAPKKDGTEATLRGSPPVLVRSIRVISATSTTAIVGSDRPYAAAHQFGYPPRNLPARPYFPFAGRTLIEWARKRIGEFVKAKATASEVDVKGKEFVRNWDRGLIRAVAEANMLTPKPDFVIFGGDLAQLGMKEELDHGAEILSRLKYKTHCVLGEHDYYLDLGKYWSKLFGPHYHSFDHKGVHFVVLNSILTTDECIGTTSSPPCSLPLSLRRGTADTSRGTHALRPRSRP